MTNEAFNEFLHNFRGFMQEEDLSRVLFLRYLLSQLMVMNNKQFALLIMALSEIEYSKKPSYKDEFERIMKAGFKK